MQHGEIKDMSGKNMATFGIFSKRASVENAVNQLMIGGYRNTDISVLFPHEDKSNEISKEKVARAPDGVVSGASAGVVVGGALGWLASIGVLVIPGVGPFIGVGPIMAALAGAGVGGVGGALIGMGFSEYAAKRYEGRVKKGGILLSVHCNSNERAEGAKRILKHSGAEDISSTGEFSIEYRTKRGSSPMY